MLPLLINKFRILHTTVCRTFRAGIRRCAGIFFCSLLCATFASCDIEDERDLCCDRIVMEYRYLQEGEDAFAENIRSLRHFLFDAEGRFLQEVPPGNDLRIQLLEPLEIGDYTMVTVGNASALTTLTAPVKGDILDDFRLQVSQASTGNADKLYYGIRRFTLVKESGHREQRFVTSLSNVHCKLRVTVKWQNLPPVLTNDPIYQLALTDCAGNYLLDGEAGYSLGEKHFPYSPNWSRKYALGCSLQGLQLIENFVSLRYTNDRLPILHILCREPGTEGEYTKITPPLDLKKAFAAWGYSPLAVERQEYKIIVTIYLDGHVGVKVEADAGVADWVEGGSFG